MKTFLILFLEFFKTGLFSVGGGYATIPFLYNMVSDYGWYTSQQLTDMIAVSIITPGPVGINMATFAGFQTTGITGAVIASIALVVPSYLIVLFVSKLLKEFHDNFYVKAVLAALKPAGCGLLTVVGINFFKDKITDIYSFILLLFLFVLSFKFHKNPLYYFVIAAFAGLLLHFCFPSFRF
ncbi:MAG: chromate transporter [Candidatus Gastranaerophilales bacterium]|nr:chromate transporter [Candidatus Gastranaerophilales bacterium]